MEVGNIVLTHEKETDDFDSHFRRKDTIALEFSKPVAQNYKSEHGLDFYARKLNLSVKHLTRTIKKILGKTPHILITDELLGEAKKQLENDNIPVACIAEALCFSDQATFCKFFKRQVGLSPMEYRRRKKIK